MLHPYFLHHGAILCLLTNYFLHFCNPHVMFKLQFLLYTLFKLFISCFLLKNRSRSYALLLVIIIVQNSCLNVFITTFKMLNFHY